MWTIESDTKTVVRKESFWRVSGVQIVGNGAKYKSTQKKKKKNRRGGERREREGGSLSSPPLYFSSLSLLCATPSYLYALNSSQEL